MPSVATAVRVKADPSLVHVVVANLVSNAFDFAGDGVGGRPRDRRRGQGSASGHESASSDNGPGVSDSVRPRLFEPFVTGRPNGVGIGLALSRKIARAHGGDLVLEEQVSEASFDFTLPLEAA